MERVAHRVVECQLSDEGWALQRLRYGEAARLPDLYDQVVARGSQPVLDVLAGRLSSLANRGHLELNDPVVAAAQFMALVSGNLPGLSALGTRPVSDEALHTAVRTGGTPSCAPSAPSAAPARAGPDDTPVAPTATPPHGPADSRAARTERVHDRDPAPCAIVDAWTSSASTCGRPGTPTSGTWAGGAGRSRIGS
ncbi:TetR/AcrR family transcriptional regulator C-terminal domain-containing protein [Kitasatospora sp. NPDC057015]|uniref:TetR/AcrR family transcriptional regulator C-terminal domain-containing protein n=1 Tax=Kitasatospora sp. NPDC057015 TaxID=3346001 RepID=UPI00362A8518